MPQQRNLFDKEPEPWEADDQTERLIARVILSSGPDQEFDYLVPDELREAIEPGRRVRVPLGHANRPVLGYCVRIENRPTGGRKLKAIQAVIDSRTLLSPPMLRLTRWLADYYLCPWATVLETVLPAGVRTSAGTRLTTFLSIAPEVAGRLAQEKIPPKQAAVLKVLSAASSPMTATELARAAKCGQGPIATLRRKGLISSQTGRVQMPQYSATPVKREKHLVLNADQREPRSLTP